MSTKVAEVITSRFIDSLERGVVPWRQPWKTVRPFNFASKHQYTGVNAFSLGLSGYADPRWGTKKNILEAGGRIKREEYGKYTPVLFMKQWTPKPTDEDETPEPRWILRFTKAWNVEQCEGLDLPVLPEGRLVISDAVVERFLVSLPSKIVPGQIAAYSASKDEIILPMPELFVSQHAYYSVAFHEATHATGHPDRLDRFTSNMTFASEDYSQEELIAEIGSALLRTEFAVESEEEFAQSTAYVSGWIRALNSDPYLILSAARKAEESLEFYRDRIEGSKDGSVEPSRENTTP